MSGGEDEPKPARERRNDSDFKNATGGRTKAADLAEARRNLKWLSFAKNHVSFGFQHLPPAFVPAMSNECRGLAICFERVVGWQIPPTVFKEFDKKDYSLTVQLSLSMFHLRSASFFGSTWMGPEIQLGDNALDASGNIAKAVDFNYQDIVYLMSRISDSSCVGVLEIVVSKRDTRKEMIASQFG
jgi:hypothetical protein